MIRRKEQTSTSAIKNLIKKLGLEEKLLTVQVEEIWRKTMGNNISKHTTKISIENKTLLIYLNSGALKQELSMNQQKLLTEINKQIEQEYFEKIKFI